MIDFRYHLVSIVAVFLALAVGIVVGATALQGHVISALNTASQHELKANETLQSQKAQLKQQISADNAFGQAASGYLLSHLLQGQDVVLVTAPGADGPTVSGITTALQQSGATVTGQVSLSPQFFDTSATTQTTLTSLATQLAPAGVTLPTSTAIAQIPGQQAAGQVIAAAIMSRSGLAPVTSQESQSILSGFAQQGFLQISGPKGAASLSGPATLAVVVIPAVAPSNASSPANLALVTLTHELAQAGTGALLAGSLPGSGPGSAIDAVTSGSAGVAVTTVDNADTAIGQIVVVQALRQLMNPHATPTSYGVGPVAVPSPAPSTSPTPTSSPTAPTPSASKKSVKG